MNIDTRDNILRWTNLTNEIIEQWIKDYFEIEEDETIYFDWVNLGSVFYFADYYIDMKDVLECRRLDVASDVWHRYYEFCLETESKISLEDFILSPKKLKEKEEKHLEELKERLKLAEKLLKEALDKYEKD